MTGDINLFVLIFSWVASGAIAGIAFSIIDYNDDKIGNMLLHYKITSICMFFGFISYSLFWYVIISSKQSINKLPIDFGI